MQKASNRADPCASRPPKSQILRPRSSARARPHARRPHPRRSAKWSRGLASAFTLWLLSLFASLGDAAASEPAFERIPQAELPAALKPAGTLVTALRWRDKGGVHVAAFWRKLDDRKGEARLRVDVWQGDEQAHGSVVRTVKDAISQCEFDLYAEFIDEALSLTDLDGDGQAELTFAYRQTCTSDVSPFALKLIVLEQRAKYAIRGTTSVDIGGGERVGGEAQIDPALRKQPALLRHAQAVWSKIVALNPWHNG